jgi:hypothetical protein
MERGECAILHVEEFRASDKWGTVAKYLSEEGLGDLYIAEGIKRIYAVCTVGADEEHLEGATRNSSKKAGCGK